MPVISQLHLNPSKSSMMNISDSQDRVLAKKNSQNQFMQLVINTARISPIKKHNYNQKKS